MNAVLTTAYLDQMRAHLDEGGTLNHRNAVDLLAEVQTLRSDLVEWKQAHEDLVEVRRQDIAAMQAKLERALADPEHAEYAAIVEEVAKLAEGDPLPRREVPLAFMMTLLARRREQFRAVLAPKGR